MLSRRLIFHVVRRYLNYTREEWLALPWDMQRTHLEGLADEDPPKIVLNAGEREPESVAPLTGPGVNFDIVAMVAEMGASAETG